MQQAGEGRSIPRPSGGSGCECACRVGAGSSHMKAGTSILRRGKYACECRCLNRPGVGGHVGVSVSRPEGGSRPVSLFLQKTGEQFTHEGRCLQRSDMGG